MSESGVGIGDQYKAVSDRRRQSDLLAWQLPTVAIAASAFLYNVAWDAGRSVTLRIGAAMLGAAIGAGFALLLLRHRKSEMVDARWLAAVDSGQPPPNGAHGKAWADARNDMDAFGRDGAWPNKRAATFGLWVALWFASAVGLVTAIGIVIADFAWSSASLPQGLQDLRSRDGWAFAVDVISILSGVLAVAAIYLAVKARGEATRQLARERRLDFEIDLLLHLIDVAPSIGWNAEANARVALLSADDIPVTRWASGIQSDWTLGAPVPTGEGAMTSRRIEWHFVEEGRPNRNVLDRVKDELSAAILRRLDERR